MYLFTNTTHQNLVVVKLTLKVGSNGFTPLLDPH